MSAPNPPRKTPEERAAAADETIASAQVGKRRAEAAKEYGAITKPPNAPALKFTKDFNTRLEAVIRDSLATNVDRFTALLRRYSWGENSLYAIGVDGYPLTQDKAATLLALDKRVVSKVVAYLESRGYMRREGRKLFLVIAPELGPVPDPTEPSKEYQLFVENWKVANASDWQEREVARGVVSRINKVILSEYRTSQGLARKAGASLYDLQDVDQTLASEASLAQESLPPTPYQESESRRPRKTQPAKPASKEVEMQSQCRRRLFAEIRGLQDAFPESNFSADLISENDPRHQTLVSIILKCLGDYDQEYVGRYIAWIEQNFRGRGGKHLRNPRHPGATHEIEGLGLLKNWAEDFDRTMGGAVKQRAQAQRDRLDQQEAEARRGKSEAAWRAACPAGAEVWDLYLADGGEQPWWDHVMNCAVCSRRIDEAAAQGG